MATQEYPTLFGSAPSWADITITFPIYGGELVATSDIASLDCSTSIEVGVKRGTSGGRKMATTTGQEDCECSVEFYRAGWRTFKRALAGAAPSRAGVKAISLVGFDILIKHSVPGDDEIYVVKVAGCRVGGEEFAFAEGSDADKVTVPIICKKVIEIVNGEEIALL